MWLSVIPVPAGGYLADRFRRPLLYAAMMLGPAVAGRLAKSAGTAAVALDLGALTVLACAPLMWLFGRIVSVGHRRSQS